MVSVVKSGISCDSTDSIPGRLSVSSISSASEANPEQVPLPESMILPSILSPEDGSQDWSPQLPKTTSAFVPASVSPQTPDTANLTISRMSTYMFDAADTV
jgi:hypothetical protein